MSDKETEVYRDGKVHVRNKKCNHCLFSPDRIVSGARARDIVSSARGVLGSSFLCHKAQVSDEPLSICAAYWDAFHMEDPILRLADVMGVVQRVQGLEET